MSLPSSVRSRWMRSSTAIPPQATAASAALTPARSVDPISDISECRPRSLERETASFIAMTVEDLLAAARSKLERLGPEQARAAMADGGVLIDIRAESQRARDGVVPEA